MGNVYNSYIGKKPARTASPVVRQLFEEIDALDIPYKEITARSGVHAVTLSYWKHGKNSPRWVDFENVAKAIGFSVVLQRDTV